MSRSKRASAKKLNYASAFAALGDETRLFVVKKLSNGQSCSISELTEQTDLTRQAITKHLRVLESAGIVESVRSGRETLFKMKPEPIKQIRNYLDEVSAQWDSTLTRLKAFVEKPL